jgi:hypothetical protein
MDIYLSGILPRPRRAFEENDHPSTTLRHRALKHMEKNLSLKAIAVMSIPLISISPISANDDPFPHLTARDEKLLKMRENFISICAHTKHLKTKCAQFLSHHDQSSFEQALALVCSDWRSLEETAGSKSLIRRNLTKQNPATCKAEMHSLANDLSNQTKQMTASEDLRTLPLSELNIKLEGAFRRRNDPYRIFGYLQDPALTKAQRSKRKRNYAQTHSLPLRVEDAQEGSLIDQIWGMSILNNKYRIVCNTNFVGTVDHISKNEIFVCAGRVTGATDVWGTPTLYVASETIPSETRE